ncbi:hypothetical protein [Rathayibacter sp. VKM Ac-2760]|uniref:hypothetical protein n=1 Tax=Rathayibacter sp. VKM Ac-2760 TaxID=2609253 RepID=UPI0013183CAE|nr:hypothetical protein [Rathayibacter sp. VKM Ac-2760]QHC57583.1 hypothetical protein GSU72_02515 [Rathayibacter sp. VKM Ac-2760]
MTSVLREIRRELRGAVSSRLLLVLLLAGAVFAAWSAVTDCGNAESTAALFMRTAADHTAAGQSVEEALAAPLTVTSLGDGRTEIDNPLRFDFEAAVAASAALDPAGAVSTALSLALVLATPLLGYAVGLFAATTDLRSGSIIVRWPQVRGVRTFLAAKAALLVLAVLTFGGALALCSSLAGLVTAQLRPSVLGDAVREPPADPGRIAALSAAFLLIGVAFAALGFCVATVTRERAFSLTGFALAYYLLPILGPWDPRNLIPSVAAPWLAFHGGFQPRAVGDLGVLPSALSLSAGPLLLFGVCAAVWTLRDRTPDDL